MADIDIAKFAAGLLGEPIRLLDVVEHFWGPALLIEIEPAALKIKMDENTGRSIASSSGR